MTTGPRILLSLIAFVAIPAASAQAPAPKPKLDRAEFELLAGDAAARGLDAVTTLRFIHEPNAHENELPAFIYGHKAVMWSYSMGEVGAQYLVARELTRHHHPRIAHWITFADIGYDGTLAVSNVRIWNGKPGPCAGGGCGELELPHLPLLH